MGRPDLSVSKMVNSLLMPMATLPTFLLSAFIVPIVSFVIFGGIGALSNWAAYGIFALFILATILSGTSDAQEFKEKRNPPHLSLKSEISLFAFLCTLLIPLANTALNGSYNVPDFARLFLSLVGLATLVSFGALSQVHLKGLFSVPLLLGFSIAALIFAAFAGTRIGSAVKHVFKGAPVTSGAIALGLGIVLVNLLYKLYKTRKTKHSNSKFVGRIVFLAQGLLSFFLAFRTDSIFQIAGAHYHWSYFTGPIQTIRSGGTLLWDTPSQYGLGPVLIPAIMPIYDPVTSFYFFQAGLMLIVSWLVLGTIYALSQNPRAAAFFGFTWIIFFYFADPELIGPQPYPSSSAVRFGPSLILALLLILRETTEARTSRKFDVLIAFVFTSAFWWSAESGLYSIAIGAAYLLFLRYFSSSLDLSRNNRRLMYLTSIFQATMFAGLVLFFLVRKGAMPDFSMMFMYSSGYAAGFGSYPLAIGTPATLLVVVLGITSTFWKFRGQLSQKRNLAAISFIFTGAFGGWFTYYVGRAVPDNVIAMLPLVILGLTLLLIVSIKSSATKKAANLHSRLDQDSKTWFIVLSFTYISLCSLVLVPQLTHVLAENRIPGVNAAVSSSSWTSAVIDDTHLKDEITAIPLNLQGLPISYEGFGGIYQELRPKQTWLPGPLGLLEEPISEVKRAEIVNRFTQGSQRDGLLLIDTKRSFPERVESWKKLISQSHNCEVVSRSENAEVLFCKYVK